MKLSKRFIEKQLYRVGIVGIMPFLKDLCSVTTTKTYRRVTGSSVQVIGDSNPYIRILYIHSGWAIYNVGILWFSHVPGLQCTLVEVDEFRKHPELQQECDVVFFGYSYLLLLSKGLHISKPILVAVHDPIELYSEVPNWKALEPNPEVITQLNHVTRIVTVSKEVGEHLAKAGVNSIQIPTSSILPPRPVEELRAQSGPLRVFTTGRVYARKNYELFKDVKRVSMLRFGKRVEFSAKWDYTPLPEGEYIRRLDLCDIYLVTSYQEGGPLPAMDAMLRGALVLSTPVGQMLEVIQDGCNGFICNSLDEFVQHIEELANDPQRLITMRRNALLSIQMSRASNVIVAAVLQALA